MSKKKVKSLGAQGSEQKDTPPRHADNRSVYPLTQPGGECAGSQPAKKGLKKQEKDVHKNV